MEHTAVIIWAAGLNYIELYYMIQPETIKHT